MEISDFSYLDGGRVGIQQEVKTMLLSNNLSLGALVLSAQVYLPVLAFDLAFSHSQSQSSEIRSLSLWFT